jgi:periplasmic protein TonB
MRRWPWITALTLSVLAVHGAGLWALHVYHSTAAPQPSAWQARVLPSPPSVSANVVTQPAALAEPLKTERQTAPHAQPPAALAQTTKTNKTIASDTPAIAKPDFTEKSPAAEIASATPTNAAAQPVAAGKPINPTARTDQPANTSSTLSKDTPEKTIRADARLDADNADTQYRHPYPALSKKLAEEGAVLLRVVVDAQGKPVSAAVVQSSGYARLDDAGQQTVMRWRFKPATVNGVPEAQSTVLQAVKFRLSTEASSP